MESFSLLSISMIIKSNIKGSTLWPGKSYIHIHSHTFTYQHITYQDYLWFSWSYILGHCSDLELEFFQWHLFCAKYFQYSLPSVDLLRRKNSNAAMQVTIRSVSPNIYPTYVDTYHSLPPLPLIYMGKSFRGIRVTLNHGNW